MGLLRNLLEYYGQNPGTNIIRQIDVLYSKEPAKEAVAPTKDAPEPAKPETSKAAPAAKPVT